MGLENIHEERFPFGQGWEVVRFTAHMVEPQVMPIIGYPRSWSSSTEGVVNAEVTYVTIETEGDLAEYRGELEGKIVFLQPIREVNMLEGDLVLRMTPELKEEASRTTLPATGGAVARGGRRGGGRGGRGGGGGGAGAGDADRRLSRNEINDFLLAENAAVLIDRGSDSTTPAGGSNLSWATQRTDGGTIFPGGGGPRDENAGNVVPSATIAVEHYNRMMRILEKGIPVRMELDIQTRFHPEAEANPNGFNIIAEIPGTDLADEIVMIGGHFDSTHGSVGATDNATGVSAMMETLRIFKELGIQPRRTVRIGLWGGEEQGLIGSRVYVGEHFASRDMSEIKPDYDKLSVYFNIDNGAGRIQGVWLQGNLAVKPIFEQWMTMVDDLGMDTLGPRSVGGTDHGSFDAVGLPGFQFMQDRLEYNARTHHSNMDFYDRVQAEDMIQMATIVAVFTYNAAMRDEKLPRKPMAR